MLDIVDMEAIQVLLLLIFCFLLLLLLYKCNKVVSLLRCAAATKKKVIAVAGTAGCCCCSWNLLLLLLLPMWLSCAAQLCQAAPPSTAAAGETAWPPMQHYDIWSADLLSAPLGDEQLEMDSDLFAREQKEVEQELGQQLEEEELPVQEQLLLQQQAYSYHPEWNTINLGSSSRRPKGELRKFKVDHIYFPFLPPCLQ